MTVKDVLQIIDIDESICIEDKNYHTIQLNTNKYIHERFYDLEVIKCFSERYRGISSIGITLIVNVN